ncbi:hypothetical protein ACF08N_11565 [Streptomyces sp. NPDC015127]
MDHCQTLHLDPGLLTRRTWFRREGRVLFVRQQRLVHMADPHDRRGTTG